jgi:hypothetical protein
MLGDLYMFMNTECITIKSNEEIGTDYIQKSVFCYGKASKYSQLELNDTNLIKK